MMTQDYRIVTNLLHVNSLVKSRITINYTSRKLMFYRSKCYSYLFAYYNRDLCETQEML